MTRLQQSLMAILAGTILVLGVQGISAAGTFTVVNTDDSGTGSLRWAIESANANPGLDLISFGIPGDGPHTIRPLTPLPHITDPVTIDGYTQPDATPATDSSPATLLIELDGSNVADLHWDSGLTIGAGSSTVRGLAINRFGDAGIHIGDEAGGNVIEGNHIGTDVTGMLDLGNYDDGVRIWNTPNSRIGGTTPAARNVISGSNDNGVEILLAGATGNQVQGNYIGVDAAGTGPLGNPNDGVHITEEAGYNTIGPGNIISGNVGTGIEIFGEDVTGNQVVGNFIGTDVTGSAGLGNGDGGVRIWRSPGNTIGGTSPGSGNVISGNSWAGVDIGRAGATGNQVQGNYIGTDVTGTAALGNEGDGVHIWKAPGNAIGGISGEARNVISGNTVGVGIFGDGATGNQVQGNYVGTDVTGAVALGNSSFGVLMCDGPSNNTIGPGNVISANGGADYGGAVEIGGEGSTTNHLVVGNLIGTDSSGTGALGNTCGVRLLDCTGNTVEDNIVSNSGIVGITVSGYPGLYPSSNNIITGNTVRLSIGFGLQIESSDYNTIYNNNFIDNGLETGYQVVDHLGIGNVFNLDKPIGGNYWSDWTGPDADYDGFVDLPYPIWTPEDPESEYSNQDSLPWAAESLWLSHPAWLTEQLVAQVVALNLSQGVENSLDAKLEAVARALDDLNAHNDAAAIGSLQAFIGQVEAQRGKTIPEEDADALIAAAQVIIDLLAGG